MVSKCSMAQTAAQDFIIAVEVSANSSLEDALLLKPLASNIIFIIWLAFI